MTTSSAQLPTIWLAPPPSLLPSSHKVTIEPAFIAISAVLATIATIFMLVVCSKKSKSYIDNSRHTPTAVNTPNRLPISNPIPIQRSNTTATPPLPLRSLEHTRTAVLEPTHIPTSFRQPTHPPSRQTSVRRDIPVVTVNRLPSGFDDATTAVEGKEGGSGVGSESEDEERDDGKRRSGSGRNRMSFQLLSNAQAGIPRGGHWEAR